MIGPLFHGVQISIKDDATPTTLGVTITPNQEINNTTITDTTTSGSFSVGVTGGTGDYTYDWQLVAGFGGTINTPTATSSTITLNTPFPDLYDTSFTVFVVDSAGNVGADTGSFIVFKAGTAGMFIP
jgi:hypothetical protein